MQNVLKWDDAAATAEWQKLLASRRTFATTPLSKKRKKETPKNQNPAKEESQKSARPKYVVDTTEKPQDAGTPNELILKQ